MIGQTGPAPHLGPHLQWALVLSLLASAWAIWWPQSESAVPPSPHSEGGREPSAPPTSGERTLAEMVPGAGLARDAPGSAASVPVFAPPVLSEATSDPFYPRAPDALTRQSTSQVTAAAVESVEAAASTPQAPPMTNRVLGRFAAPDGREMIFLQDGPQAVLAAPGVELSNGYRIEAITASEIRLRHPLLVQTVGLPLPTDKSP